ncbi:Pancreatic lipase-related protein 2 [Halotydeus destructor]|nr:Pancreatic lipase-related protein 2 [Halotydeus destructor]
MMPSYFLYFVCLFSRYVSFVTSIPHVDPCVQWVRNKYGDRYVYRDGSYFFNGTDKIRSRMVHPCLLAMYLENLNGYTVATQTPDHNPLTNQWPPATIPRRDYGNSMILSGYEEPAYHLGLLPMDVTQLNTTFLFVDGNFDRCTLIQPSEHAPRFIRRGEYEKIYVLAHDFNQDPSPDANDAMQFLASWLLRYDVPADVVQPKILAILVDWTAGARAGLNNTFYRQAAVNTIVVGRQGGVMIEQLADAGSVNLDNMHLIGEGLGAQVLHFAARWFTTGQASDANMIYRVGRLTALDPMAAHFEGFRPLFGEWPHVSRLDAIRVDVITTSGGKNLGLGPDALNGQVGMGQSVGFKQFYVNGGQEQPSCLDTWPGTEHIYYDFCSHEKALMYFLYSLRPEVDRVLLMARPAPDYRSFLQAIQDDVAIDINMHAYLGMEAFNGGYNLDGDFYISINLNHNLEASHLEVAMTPEKEPRKFNYRFLSVPMAPYTPDTPDVYLQHGAQIANLSTLDAKSCGKFRQDPKHSQDGRVFRGQRPYAGQFPWAVCMVTYREDEQRWWNECTGAILDKHWILIAAHCFL